MLCVFHNKINKSYTYDTEFAFEWLVLLLHMHEVTGSSIG
jgi:hypothetical protein